MSEKISYEDFRKVELRTATILSVEEIPKKDKLYKLQIDLGSEKRTILAGIKQSYSKEELVGKQIVVVANLLPAKIAGIESNGMMLAAGEENVDAIIVLDKKIANGTIVR
ncbi:MAG: methionine--tRNA ligase subunit beta [Candidatus Diapherotrites archaeon]|nr:methionine--tRNA ligase subunit beta [Candidatus Diapherotrites archaeon]